MATVTLYAPTNMNAFDWVYGMPATLADLTTRTLRVSDVLEDDSVRTAVYSGNFTYEGFTPEGATVAEKLGLVGGTMRNYVQFEDGIIRVRITDFLFDAVTALIYADLGQPAPDGDPAYDTELLSLVLAGDDIIQGSPFDDVLNGFDGNDNITGGARNDRLFGDTGNDRLDGGAARDFLSGAAGIDTFIFRAANEIRTDVITDFRNDRIDLAQIDANNTAGNDQAFVLGNFIVGQAGRLDIDAFNANTDKVRGDVNGDAIADFEILVVRGATPLVAGDFLL